MNVNLQMRNRRQNVTNCSCIFWTRYAVYL